MIETFLNIPNHPSILRIETTNETKKTKLPPFVSTIREVTNEDAYETLIMAHKEYSMPNDDVMLIQEKLEEERERNRQNMQTSPTGFKKPTGQMSRGRTDSRLSSGTP